MLSPVTRQTTEKSLEFGQEMLQTSEKENNENSVPLSFAIIYMLRNQLINFNNTLSEGDSQQRVIDLFLHNCVLQLLSYPARSVVSRLYYAFRKPDVAQNPHYIPVSVDCL